VDKGHPAFAGTDFELDFIDWNALVLVSLLLHRTLQSSSLHCGVDDESTLSSSLRSGVDDVESTSSPRIRVAGLTTNSPSGLFSLNLRIRRVSSLPSRANFNWYVFLLHYSVMLTLIAGLTSAIVPFLHVFSPRPHLQLNGHSRSNLLHLHVAVSSLSPLLSFSICV
jgi:hypothetical protein